MVFTMSCQRYLSQSSCISQTTLCHGHHDFCPQGRIQWGPQTLALEYRSESLTETPIALLSRHKDVATTNSCREATPMLTNLAKQRIQPEISLIVMRS